MNAIEFCFPAGDRARPRPVQALCIAPGCDLRGAGVVAILRPVPREGVRDHTLDCWDWVDEYGLAVVDRTPAALLADPAKWWADLAREHIEVYSSLDARVRLGQWSWHHHHQPGSTYTDEYELPAPPPVCHERPMFAGVTGWVCRERKTVWSYPS